MTQSYGILLFGTPCTLPKPQELKIFFLGKSSQFSLAKENLISQINRYRYTKLDWNFCSIYRYFKHNLILETYLLDLDNSNRFVLTTFRYQIIYIDLVLTMKIECVNCVLTAVLGMKNIICQIVTFFASKRNNLVLPHLPRQSKDSKCLSC